MTTRRGSENFLDKPADELTELLLRVARADAAPNAARERALQNVAVAALGIGVLSGAAALGSRATLLKGTSWLVAKWLTVGVSSGLLGIAVAQGVQQLAAKPAPQPLAPRTVSASSKVPARLVPRSAPLAPELATPEAEPAPAQQLPAQTAHAAANPTAALGHEPRSASRTSSNGLEAAAALASSKSSLTRELTLLELARSALTGHSASGALHTLDQYRAEFPRGSMHVEAAALRVEAVEQSGDRALAQRLAESFLTTFPSSPLAARVRAVSEPLSTGTQKP